MNYLKKKKKEINWLDVVFGLAFMFPVALWCGYVTSILWGWFMVPSLGVPPLSTVAAAGIIQMISFMHPTSTEDSEESGLVLKLLTRSIYALLVLSIGSILNLWM